jgi:hypothetical protein
MIAAIAVAASSAFSSGGNANSYQALAVRRDDAVDAEALRHGIAGKRRLDSFSALFCLDRLRNTLVS